MYKKVLILANSASGLFDFRQELIIALKEKGCEVVASLPDQNKVDELEKIGCRVIHTDLERRGINPITDLKLIKDYNKLLNAEKPDLVITYTIKPNVYGGFLCRVKHIPYAVNITGLGTTFQKKGLLRSLVVFLDKLGFKKAKVVFFENVENLEIIVNEGIIKREQACLLNGAGVNLDRFYFTEYPKDRKETKFLFIGRAMREKGINELLYATKRLVNEGFNVSLDLLGGFEEDYEGIINKYQEEGWLRYHGYQNDVKPFIIESNCFVLPSYHEGMANTNLECSAMGRPIITSNIHGCLEAVNQNGFLVNVQDQEDLYEKMRMFIDLPYEEKVQMGLNSRKHMEDVFNKRKVVSRTVNKLFGF